jgi:transposase InsO family protein
LVNNYGIKKKNSTPFNPQSNGIIERVHLTLNDSLRTAEIDGREMDEKYPWGPFLFSAAYAIRSTLHTTLKAAPGQLVFGRDMVLPIKFMAD